MREPSMIVWMEEFASREIHLANGQTEFAYNTLRDLLGTRTYADPTRGPIFTSISEDQSSIFKDF